MNDITRLCSLPDSYDPQKWIVKDSKVEFTSRSIIPLIDLIDFVSVLQFAQTTLAKPENATLDKSRVGQVFLNLDTISQRLQQSLDKKCWLEQLIIKVIVFVFTWTTLSKAYEGFKATAKNKFEMTKKESLELIPKDFADYKVRAWKLPTVQAYLAKKPDFKAIKGYDIGNKFEDEIYKLGYLTRAAMGPSIVETIQPLQRNICANWNQIISLLGRGVTWEDPQVLELCDKTMDLCNLLVRHAYEDVYSTASEIEYAIVCKHLGKEALGPKEIAKKTLITKYTNQAIAGCFNIELYTRFYGWVRAHPSIVSEAGSYTKNNCLVGIHWKVGSKEHPEWEKQFTTPGTLQNKWCSEWEALDKLLMEKYLDEKTLDHRNKCAVNWPQKEQIEHSDLILKPPN